MKGKTGEWSLWLAVVLLFGLLLGAWTLFFRVAARHPVQSVPIEKTAPSPARP